MLKTSAILELKIGDNVYQLHLPNTAALGEVHDALYQMRSYVIDRINEAKSKDAPEVPVEPKEVVNG